MGRPLSYLINVKDYIFPVFIDHRPDLIGPARARFTAAAHGEPFHSTTECEHFLVGLTTEVRENLLTPLDLYLEEDLTGECPWGQAMSMVIMESLGLSPLGAGRAYTPNSDEAEHTFAILPLMILDQPTHYLIDLTYLQFCESFRADDTLHGARFSQAQNLANKGFVKLTPHLAKEFLAAFDDEGDHYETPEAAMQFMLNCPYNQVQLRDNARTKWMKKQGTGTVLRL